MDAKKLYELNKSRQERNKRIDLASDRFSGCIVNGERGNYSTVYSIQINESNAVFEIVKENIEDFDNNIADIIDVFKKSLTDSISIITKHPISEEEVSFLFINNEKKDVKSVKFQNLFSKSQFSIVDFLKNISHIIANIVINLQDVDDEVKNKKILFIFKCVCCTIFTISELIQDLEINFDEKYSKILYSLIDDKNGFIGIDQNTFISDLLNKSNDLFNDKQDVQEHINTLVTLGCVQITDSEDKLIKLKEKIVKF